MKFRSTTTVNDAMGQTSTMNSSIKPIYPGIKLIGTAYTVQCQPGGIITCHKALAKVPSGSILVVNGYGDSTGAVWGGLMSLEAIQRGVKGIVVDGAVRDISTIKELDFPTFARHVTPRVGKNKVVGSLEVPIACGGVTVNTGDLIIGDDDGIVVIPKDSIQEILEKADMIDKKEDVIAEKVKKGANIGDLLGLND